MKLKNLILGTIAGSSLIAAYLYGDYSGVQRTQEVMFTQDDMDNALILGRLDVMEFVHKNCREGNNIRFNLGDIVLPEIQCMLTSSRLAPQHSKPSNIDSDELDA